jgi:hypothetical protein
MVFVGINIRTIIIITITINIIYTHRSTSRTSFGVILGSSVVLTIISLQTAIFWGQYGECEKFESYR